TYSALSVNEKHYFGRLDVGRLAFIDCTNPRPAHPVIIGLNSGEARRSTSNDKVEKPSLSVNVHALVPGESTVVNVGCASVKDVLLPLQHLRVDVAPVTVKLVDSFLFILRQAGICILETTQQTVSTRTMQELEEDCHSHVDHLASPSSFEEIPVYNCHITQLNISRIDLDLTITRRSDGKFDPFSGITLGSRFIPSVERAPLSISEVERRDVSQRGSSPYSALLSLLWPSYRNQLMLQFYKIIGSLEILGNPLALISGFQRGVHSFVVEVADMNPAKGAREFLLATTSSTLHTVGLLSRVGSRTAATLSWDNDWLETRGEDARISDPMNRSGVLLGMAQGLLDGIEGALSRPLSGARATGFTGFCTGIATGAVGLLTRPVAGALDGFGNTAEFYSKLLQEPDEIPKAQLSYLESERNFIAAAVRNPSKFSATGRTSSSDSMKNSASSTASGSTAGPSSNFTEILTRLGPSKKWNTDGCEFVSRITYDWIRRNARCEDSHGEDATRALKRSAGVHNYALYADWNSFVANATPEEFYNWVHVALAAALGKEVEAVLSSGDFSGGGRAPSKLQRTREFLPDNQELAVALERAEVIKSTLGTRDLLKYVSLEHIFLVCSLDEVKVHFSPGMIYKELPQLILSGARESLIYILCGGVEE
ncbi:vacuolar protein sorting-associated protein 13 family protein, partial [Trypanosoma cruzi]